MIIIRNLKNYLLKKKFKNINFSNYLNSIKKITKKHYNNFNKQKNKYNYKNKRIFIFNKKAIFYSIKRNGGYLKIND